MQALTLEAPLSLSVRTVPVPDVGDGELLIRVVAATTCGTDLKAYRRGHPQIPMPGPFGHEYSGIVVAAGARAKLSIGDDVMGVHSAPCQKCFCCLHGQENLCESIMETKVLGAYAEYLLVPARIANLNVFPKPKRLSFEQAALLEPLACVAQGILELAPKAGERILVIGPGAIGLMFVSALVKLDVEVTLAGRNPARLAVGSAFGAETASLDVLGSDFDAVIECTGQAEIWERSVDFSRRGGRIMLFGGVPSGTRVSWDAGRLHYDQITLLSPFHFGTEAVKLARSWLVDDRMDLSPLLSGDRSLAEAEDAFKSLEAGEGIKYVFRP